MPRVSLFLPPLLGGFLFAIIWYPTRYWVHREGGYKLVFSASIAGGVSFLLTALLTHFLLPTPWGARVAGAWHEIVPITHSGKSVLAALLAPIAAVGLNQVGRWVPRWSKDDVKAWLIGRRNDPLERFVRRAMGSNQLVLVTLSNDQVLVGRISADIKPSEPSESFRLYLTRTGVLDPVTKQPIFTRDYDEVLERIRKQKEREAIEHAQQQHPEWSLDDAIQHVAHANPDRFMPTDREDTFRAVIVASELVSIEPFDPTFYDHHLAPARTPNSGTPPRSPARLP